MSIQVDVYATRLALACLVCGERVSTAEPDALQSDQMREFLARHRQCDRSGRTGTAA